MFDCLDALDEILKILGEVLECLLELAAGFSKLGRGRGGSRRTNT
jgi:hypothetical protein